MNTRSVTGLVALAALLATGCGRNTSSTPPPETTPAPSASAASPSATPAGGSTASGAITAGGLRWQAPASWGLQPERPMRAATYTVPKAAGDPEDGEVSVFYFGPNDGGGVQANIDRWIGQVKQPDGSASAKLAKIEKVQAGVPLTTVDVSGTFLATSGPMMQVSAEKPGFRVVGAIAEGPQGAVFFKFTGPEKTVTENAPAFLEMVKAITKE